MKEWIIFFIIIVIAIFCAFLILVNRKNRDLGRDDKEQMDAIAKMNHHKKK